jgi:Zinc finger, ZZ type
VTLVIQEPLPYNTKQALKNVTQKSSHLGTPILPHFEFKDASQSEDVNAAMTHDEVNCENCGKKPVVGNLYKCANCEDYNLCEQCFNQSQYSHFSYHVFMKFQRPLKVQEKNPTTLLQVLDPRLYPASLSQLTAAQLNELSPQKKKDEYLAAEEGEEDEDFEDLLPLSMSRSLSMPMT